MYIIREVTPIIDVTLHFFKPRGNLFFKRDLLHYSRQDLNLLYYRFGSRGGFSSNMESYDFNENEPKKKHSK